MAKSRSRFNGGREGEKKRQFAGIDTLPDGVVAALWKYDDDLPDPGKEGVF